MQSGYCSFITQDFSIRENTHTGKVFLGISLIKMGLMINETHPGSISGFNITDKNFDMISCV